jgi:hypothetical protein
MGISFIFWFRVIFCVFWSFIAEGVDGVKDGGSGYTMFGVLTLLEAFLNVSLRFACITDKIFSGRKHNLWYWDYQDFWIIRH